MGWLERNSLLGWGCWGRGCCDPSTELERKRKGLREVGVEAQLEGTRRTAVRSKKQKGRNWAVKPREEEDGGGVR